MRSKIFTSVLVAVTVVPFTAFAVADAVSIKQHLHEQSVQIQSLQTEYVKIDKELNKTEAVKAKTLAETKQLEKATTDTISERQRLEAELGAN